MSEKELIKQYMQGKMSRREFIKSASLLGMSLTAIGGTLAACGAPPAATEAPAAGAAATAAPAAAAATGEGDTFVVATSEAVTGNWDPISHTNLGQLIVERGIFEGFYSTNVPENDPTEIIPTLATDWSQVDDRTYEFKLREGVKFHDGSEFDADDAKASIEWYSDTTKPGFFFVQTVFKAEVVDKYTVRAIAEKPSASAFWALNWMRMMSADDIAGGKLSERPNGTGPYKYVKQEKDSTVCEAHADYWDGAPKIKNFEFRYIGDVNTRLLALLAGEVDAAERLNPEQAAVAMAQSDLDVQIVKGVEPVFLHFRCSKPPFKDNEKLRLAMAHAIDREAIWKIMDIAGYPIYAHFPPLKLGYADVPDFPAYDPAKARALLAEAGYPDGKGLPELEFNSPVGRYPKDKEWATLATAMWQSIGIPVKLVVGDPAAWGDKLYNPDQGHMITCGWCIGNPEPDLIMFPMWRGGMAAITFIDDAEINAALDKENGTVDLEARKKVLAEETLPLLAKKMPSIPIAAHNFITGVNKRNKGFVQYNSGYFGISKIEKA
jgi:peptide/nickel transport system substrate-binding protein